MSHSRPMSGPGFMGCRGVNISGNYTEEKSLHSSSSSAAGLPNASFRPMSVKEPISRSGPSADHFKPLACIPTPLDPGGTDRPLCAWSQLSQDVTASWNLTFHGLQHLSEKRTSFGCFFRSGLECHFCDSLLMEPCQGSYGQLQLRGASPRQK